MYLFSGQTSKLTYPEGCLPRFSHVVVFSGQTSKLSYPDLQAPEQEGITVV